MRLREQHARGGECPALLGVASLDFRRIFHAPVRVDGMSGEDRASSPSPVVADGDHEVKC